MTKLRARRRLLGDEQPMVPAAHAGESRCGMLLRATSVVSGVRWEQRCIGRAHGPEERHRPGRWRETTP